jgi:hypothetical protein
MFAHSQKQNQGKPSYAPSKQFPKIVVNHLVSCATSVCHFWEWINEVPSPLDISNTPHFYMVCDGTLGGLTCGSFDVPWGCLHITNLLTY